MAIHDIIDNRSEKLVDHINRILASTESGRFAVGYFFLSGLESIGKSLASVKEIKLLIGNTTNRETIEQLAEGYRRLDLVQDKAEEQAYPKRTDIKRMAEETASNIRSTAELMDQSDDAEALLKILVRLIEEKRLKVRVYTKGRFHAKAYIFDYADMFDVLGNKVDRHENGIAIIGSSNLTLSGVSHNTELNVVVQGNNNHEELGHWFDELWNESTDFDEALMREMQQSWAVAPVTPYDIYMKTLYALVKDRLEDEDDRDILWDDDITRKLADFQKVAVRQAVQIIRDFGGVFVADVVGLGKSYIGAAIVKHFERTDHARPIIICPAPLVEMWEQYNDAYQLNARVLSTGFLYEGDNGKRNILLEDAKYRDRDFVLVDESHNFRYSDRRRTLCVVIRNGVDPIAHRVAPHHPGVIRLQHVGHCSHVVHSRIEPQIITVWVKDDRHSIMDGCGHRVRCRCQDRARLDPLPARVFPAIPQSREREQLAVIDFKAVRLFRLARPLPLVKSVRRDEASAAGQRIAECGLRRRRLRSGVNHLAAPDMSFAHDGISPQRISDNSRRGSFGFWRMTGTGWVGAMLYRGVHSGSSDAVSKYSSTSCFLRDNR